MNTPTAPTLPRILIIGGGFGGLEAAKVLAGQAVDVTLVDKTNHHLFQPLLYQVATAGLSAPAIAAPIRNILRKQANLTTLLGDVTHIDTSLRQVQLRDGSTLGYDHLIVAAGATHSPANDGVPWPSCRQWGSESSRSLWHNAPSRDSVGGQTLNATRHALPARRPSGSPVSGGPFTQVTPLSRRVTRADMSLNQEG